MGLQNKKLAALSIITFFLAFCLNTVSAQKIATKRLYRITRQAHDSAIALIKNDTIVPFLINKVKAYTVTIDRSSLFVKRKINMEKVSSELPGIETLLKKFKERLEKDKNLWNLRGLNSVVILLKETSDKLVDYQTNLINYSKQLTQNNLEVKVIINDPELEMQIPDTLLEMQMQDVHSEVFELDTLQQRVLNEVNLMRNRTSIALLQCNDILSDLTYESSELKMAMWHQEELPLFYVTPSVYHKNFATITLEALQRSAKIIAIYLAGKGVIIAICLLLFLFILAWSFLNTRRIKNMKNNSEIMAPILFFKRSILAASLFGLFVYSPFFLPNPTMSYLHASELLRLILLSFLIVPFLTKQSKVYGAALAALWVYYASDDLLLESAFGERWGLFVAGIFLTVILIKLIKSNENHFTGISESPVTKAVLIFSLVQVILSVIFNLTGRTSLAKIFGVSAIQCLVLAVTLKVFCAIVLEAIYMQSEAFQESRFSEFINFSALQNRFKRILWIVAIVLWVVSFIRNITLYDWLVASVISFFNNTRKIGSITFNFESVGIFILVIFLSTLISKLVNFFLGEDAADATVKRSSVGSIKLLIKLAILAMGFLIAIAASGIPLDRLSIMIGAFSVGIGFGLQNIVNNLVSGIIIAFEQPIKIGDQIEVGNKAGTVKEIGVRSSTIKSGDGANIIIPNGDLLSQHLINWTMQNRNKRVEFTIGMPYNTDITTATTLINNTLINSENVLHTTDPVVIVHAFNEKSIDVRIIFWVLDLTISGTLRSTVMIEVFDALKQAGITLQGTAKPA